jgi:site-specific DNA-methyltransferase (adenine-specific)
MKEDLTRAYNYDCLDFMKTIKSNYYDLAIIDPPYGIGEDGKSNHSRGNWKYKATKYSPKNWDKEAVSKEILDEIFRVSKNQIIFGANHFISRMPYDSSCWIFWDKEREACDFADGELAWTSFKSAAKKFSYKWNGMLQGNMKNKEIRIHPTQKPVALYKWILTNYATPGQKILDTHLGSGSSRIAAYDLGFDFTGMDNDEEIFQDQEKRFQGHKAQLQLF